MGRADWILAGPVRGPRRHAASSGLGALYQASDGNLYQMHGLGEDGEGSRRTSEDDEDDGKEGDDAPAPKMGPGKRGEIRVGPDGKRYRWVLGVGPGGKRIGFWRRLRPRRRGPRRQRLRLARAEPHRAGAAAAGRAPPPAGGRKRKPFLKTLLPFAKVAASLIPIPGVGPAVSAGLTVADKLLTKKQGVAGYEGLGALYQASDGSLYQVQGSTRTSCTASTTATASKVSRPRTICAVSRRTTTWMASTRSSDTCGCGHVARPGIDGDDALDGYVRDVPHRGLRGVRAGAGTPRRGCSSRPASFPRTGSLCGSRTRRGREER